MTEAQLAFVNERLKPVMDELFDSFVLVGVAPSADGKAERVVLMNIKAEHTPLMKNMAVVGRCWQQGHVE